MLSDQEEKQKFWKTVGRNINPRKRKWGDDKKHGNNELFETDG